MKTLQKYKAAFNHFKKSYSFKMGGTQTILLPNGKEYFFDDREYYSGRGSKYNASIKHNDFGVVTVTRKEYAGFLKQLKNKSIIKDKLIKEQKELVNRINLAKLNGVYSVVNGYIELSNKEIDNCSFDAIRLAKTLNISTSNCELLKSSGKTYVFAKNTSGKTIQMYHPSLDCNSLSISITEVSGIDKERFNPKEWQGSPFADMVGQTDNANHFVC